MTPAATIAAMPAEGHGVGPAAPGAELAPRYEAIALLRRGGDLDVYDAWSHERSTRVVVKALRPDRLDRQRARRRLLAEGRLLERLTHPHIVRAYDTFTEPVPAVVLETLSGQTLSRLIEDGPLEPESIGHLGLQLASAVRYLHRNGILHLDLKPSNVIAEAGRAKLIDLSVARPPGPAPDGVGTWCYLSPEQARGGELGPAADMWGIGAVLYECVAGEAPFDDPEVDLGMAGSTGATGSSSPHPDRYPQLERRATPLQAGTGGIPEELAELIARCLESEPAARPTVEELSARLEPIAGIPPAEQRWSSAPGGTPTHNLRLKRPLL
jgi:eukaryotic-like serine/threonine-protein kinase